MVNLTEGKVPEYLIIGPSSAGKTALLSTLFQAALDPDLARDNVRISWNDINGPMSNLIEKASATIRQGRLPVEASLDLEEFTFTLTIRQKKFMSWKTRQAKFTVWDGPGGSLFPDPADKDRDQVAEDRFRAQLVNSLKQADGFILCLDSSDLTKALVMFEAFPKIFMSTGLSQLPCARVCICLTKADRKFREHGTGAFAKLDAADPLDACTRLLPHVALGVLGNYCTDAKFGFAWTSVYGFLDSGEPNYDEAHNKLLHWSEEDKINPAFVNQWRPYGVLEPLLWTAGVDQPTIVVARADQLL